ncbi:MAG: hypothetical protein U0T73_07340 [Chitinophagales bacterium]
MKLKPLFFFIAFFGSVFLVKAQPRIDFIDGDQLRIDKLDGVEDGRVETHDSVNTKLAGYVYFTLIDSIQRYISNQQFSDVDQRIYRDYLFRVMRRVYAGNYRQTARFEKVFTHFLAELKGIRKQALWPVLRQNPSLSVQMIGLIRYEAIADTFLNEAAQQIPDEVLQNFPQYSDRPYATRIVEEVTAIAPQVSKKYFIPTSAVYDVLKNSNDTAVVIFRKVIDWYGKKSNAQVLLADLLDGSMSISKADSITRNNAAYLKALMQIRIRRNPPAVYSVDKELEICALKMVREVNDLHNENNEAVRFAVVNSLSAEELYMLIVYSEEEIFTSTFNGIYKRLMLKLGKRSGFEFLRSMNDHRFRTFIKQCAAYGKLDGFLNTMTAQQRQILMVKFAANLGAPASDISEAVEVADAYTSISDSATLQIVQYTVKSELDQHREANNRKGLAIYGLLQNLFSGSGMFREDWYANISGQYQLPSIATIPSAKLFENNGTCVWYMNFYDDDDGDWSYRSFTATFRDALWKVDESNPLFVKINSVGGKPVEIYANKPKQEYEGQAFLEKYFDSAGIVPDVLVHRGHSYYASKTIEKATSGTKIFVLGSCGGYHNLSSIIDRSPEVSIISSKQIGVFQVNNPIVKALADNIREGSTIDWQKIWKAVDTKLKGTEPYARFQDYIPPHKNLGAIFIRAYNRIVEKENGN